MTQSAIPSTEHYLYDLSLRTIGPDGNGGMWVPIVPEVCGAHGGLHTGLVVALVDSAAGRLAVRTALPELIATSRIAVQTTTPVRADALLAENELLRHGKRSITISTTLVEHALAPGGETLAEGGRGRVVGRGIATFDALGSVYDPSVVEALEQGGLKPTRSGRAWSASFLDTIGLRAVDVDAGVFELALSPYVSNHVSALQGGIIGSLVEAAAEGACAAAVGAPVAALDFSIPYLAMGKEGPFQTRARIVRATREHAAAEVDVVDLGQDERLLTRATVVACVVAAERD